MFDALAFSSPRRANCVERPASHHSLRLRPESHGAAEIRRCAASVDHHLQRDAASAAVEPFGGSTPRSRTMTQGAQIAASVAWRSRRMLQMQ